jgi:NADPH:quinone reductase-like Zn-dependent oxidoreductase
MKAVVITRFGGSEVLELQQRPKPDPGLGQIRVRVHTSALNRADISQRRGNYPPPPGAPVDIGGMEYAGEVDTIGPGATLWKTGDRVMGIVGGGSQAEYLCVHEREAIAVPGSMSWEEAGAIPEAFITAWDALFARLHLAAGEIVLIHAVASGVGTAASQIAHVAGARVVGTSRSRDKLERTKSLGVGVAIDASRGDWATQIDEAVGRERVHAIVDLVGGLTAGATAQFNMGVLLRKRLTMVGTVLRARPLEEKIAVAREFSERVVPLFDAGRLKPVVGHVFSFDQIRAAHDLMESNQTFGKIVLRWE